MVGNRKSPWVVSQGLFAWVGQCPVLAVSDSFLAGKRQLHVKENVTFYGTMKMKPNVNLAMKGKSRRCSMGTSAQLSAFGAGTFILVVALILGSIFVLATRHASNGSGCLGCLGLLICSTFLSVAGYFFFVAFTT